jgi:hypothetical protein
MKSYDFSYSLRVVPSMNLLGHEFSEKLLLF